jgi:hypothetical protein
MTNSLLRDIEIRTVRERFHSLAKGEAVLTRYSFSYELPSSPGALAPPPILDFAVFPDTRPATNIHVLIGRNGVGKTRCFDALARTLLSLNADDPSQPTGRLRNTIPPAKPWERAPDDDPGFTGLVTVAFSAFDSKGPLHPPPECKKRYSYVGLVTDKPPAGQNPQS